MFVNFEEMTDDARVWVYQLEQKLNAEQVSFVEKYTQQFLEGWTAHGNPLKGSFRLFHNQFLVISVDQSFNQASGCSIDASVHLTQQLANELKISFSTNDQVAFMINNEVELVPFTQLKEQVSSGKIQPSTPVFNNTIQNFADLKANWLIPSEKSWMKRYF